MENEVKKDEEQVEAVVTVEPEATEVVEEVIEESAAVEEPIVEASEVVELVEPTEPSLAEELDTLSEAFDAETAVLTKRAEEAEERIERLTDYAEEREEVIQALEGELNKALADVSSIKSKLANPAFDAAVEGEKEAAEVGAAGENEDSILDQLLSIKDAKQKTKFRREHAEEIKDAQNELAG